MHITFSLHAEERMIERNISFHEVYNAIVYPLVIHLEQKRVIRALRMRLNGHLLMVLYTIYGSSYHVITVITTNQVSRYLNKYA